MRTIKILSFMGENMTWPLPKLPCTFLLCEKPQNLKEAIPDCSNALFKPNLLLLFPAQKCQF